MDLATKYNDIHKNWGAYGLIMYGGHVFFQMHGDKNRNK